MVMVTSVTALSVFFLRKQFSQYSRCSIPGDNTFAFPNDRAKDILFWLFKTINERAIPVFSPLSS